MEKLVDFLDADKIPKALDWVQVDKRGLETPDETAFACLHAARVVIAHGYARSSEERQRVARLIEFLSGADVDHTDSIVSTVGATSGGTSRLLRMMTQLMMSILDQEPQGYPMSQLIADREAVSTGAPIEAADTLYRALRENGLTPIGAAATMINRAFRAALADGASPWQMARLLVELLCDAAAELDVGTKAGAPPAKATDSPADAD